MGDIVVDMRGKSGGTTYSKGNYGLQKRVNHKGKRTISSYTQSQKATFSTNSQAWRSLTDAQRSAWRLASPNFPVHDAFGIAHSLTGSTLYNRLNNNISSAGGTVITSPPVAVSVASAVAGALTGSAGGQTLTLAFTPTPVTAGFTLLVYATAQYGAGQVPNKTKYRLLTTVASAGTSPGNIATAYISRFGALVQNQKISCKVVLCSKTTGQLGVPTLTSGTVGA